MLEVNPSNTIQLVGTLHAHFTIEPYGVGISRGDGVLSDPEVGADLWSLKSDSVLAMYTKLKVLT